MKNLLLAWWLLFVPYLITAQVKGLHFQAISVNQAKKAAKKEKKMIFIELSTKAMHMTNWLNSHVFSKDSAGDFYNSRFVCLQLDPENADGKALAKEFNITFFPSVIYLNEKGEFIHKACDISSVNALIQSGKIALSPKLNLAFLTEQIKKGNRDFRIVNQYFKSLDGACVNLFEEVPKYLSDIPVKELSRPENWMLINDFISDPEHPVFQEVLNQYQKFALMFTEDSVDAKIFKMYYNKAIHFIENNDDKGIGNLKTKMAANSLPVIQKTTNAIDIQLFMQKKDLTGLTLSATALFDQHKFENAELMNSVCWFYYLFSEDQNQLKKALNWAGKAYNLARTYYMADTYACLAYKTQNYDEAIKFEEIAIKLAKESNVPISDFEMNLKKFKSKK